MKNNINVSYEVDCEYEYKEESLFSIPPDHLLDILNEIEKSLLEGEGCSFQDTLEIINNYKEEIS